jgi:hypothetical protein
MVSQQRHSSWATWSLTMGPKFCPSKFKKKKTTKLRHVNLWRGTISFKTRRKPDITNVKVKWSRYRTGVAQRAGRGIALLFHDRDNRRGWVVSSTPRPHFTLGKKPVPILQEVVVVELLLNSKNVPIFVSSATWIKNWQKPIWTRYCKWIDTSHK